MAGMESVVVDYMGIGNVEAERTAEERGKLVKPMPAHAQSFASGPISEKDHDAGRALLNLGTGSSHNASQSYRVPTTPWTGGRVEQTDKGRIVVARPGEGKQFEDITAVDIAKLSGEDCRAMLQMMKGGISPAVASSKGTMAQPPTLLGMSPVEERAAAIRRGAVLGKSGQSEAVTKQPGLDVIRRMSDNGTRRFAPPPKFQLQSSTSVGEAHEGARPSERAGPITEPYLSLSIRSAQDPSVSQSGPAGLRMLRQPEPPNRGLQLGTHSGQGAGAQAGAVSRAAGPAHLPGRPPTAQLTIFYAGRVNVYDDVPADKAEAIMLLAGSGSSWSSSIMNLPQSVHPAGVPALQTTPKSLAAVVATSVATGAAVPSVSQAVPAMSSLVSSISVAGREMPQARKKSLARFLENRKDRVRAKSPYAKPEGPAKNSSNPARREKSPSPGNGTVRTRSPSPAHAIQGVVITRSPSPAQRTTVSRASRERTISPTKPPATPQQSSRATGSEDLASQGTRVEGGLDWRNHSRVSSSEQNPEAMEESH